MDVGRADTITDRKGVSLRVTGGGDGEDTPGTGVGIGAETGRSGEDLMGAVDGKGLTPFTLAGGTGADFLFTSLAVSSSSQVTVFVVPRTSSSS
jgi:hypothetical protein